MSLDSCTSLTTLLSHLSHYSSLLSFFPSTLLTIQLSHPSHHLSLSPFIPPTGLTFLIFSFLSPLVPSTLHQSTPPLSSVHLLIPLITSPFHSFHHFSLLYLLSHVSPTLLTSRPHPSHWWFLFTLPVPPTDPSSTHDTTAGSSICPS